MAAPEATALLKDVQPSSFQNVTPGKSSVQDLREALGEPVSQTMVGDQSIWTYGETGPFKQLEVVVARDRVESVVIHLKQPSNAAQIVAGLGLVSFLGTTIRDEQDSLLGVAYPDRGVVLNYDEASAKTPGALVSQIILDQITPEPFLLRAEELYPNRPRRALRDLDVHRLLAPGQAAGEALRARIELQVGQLAEARTACDQALQRSDASQRESIELLAARITAAEGRIEEATNALQQLVERTSDVALRAEALVELGNLRLQSPASQLAEALQLHQQAITLGKQLAASTSNAERRTGRRVLWDAHLSIAHNVAWGNWKRKPEVVPRWIENAQTLATAMHEQDRADPLLQLITYRRTLQCFAGAKGELPGDEIAKRTIELGQQLLKASSDPLYQRSVQWEVGGAMVAAMIISRDRGEMDKSLGYGRQAHSALMQAAPDVQRLPAARRLLLGELNFSLGSLQAIGQDNHAQAVHWFTQSLDHFMAPGVVTLIPDLGLHGERFVSMGVSFWQEGKESEAIRLTQQGLNWMEQAVAEQRLESSALSVPLENLARMYRKLGDAESADKMARRAAELAPLKR